MPAVPDPRRDAAANYLLSRVNYERVTTVPYCPQRFKLDRMRELLRRLGSPQCGVPVVHVAGTKGKGSTATMVAAILTDAGYRTGLFTSPHLERIEERFAIDGRPCSADELADLVDRVKPAVEAIDSESAGRPDPEEDRPTYFEITTAMAFEHFARRAVEVAVLEVGLGGRLDSTNVAEPVVSAITSISLDHTAQLGETLEAIAAEKAGIIRPGVPVVSGVTEPAPRDVIREQARRLGAPLVEAATDFVGWVKAASDVPSRRPGPAADPPRITTDPPRIPATAAGDSFDYLVHGAATHRGLRLAMPGRHQVANAAVALAVVDELKKAGWDIPDTAVRSGLARAVCPGRVEILDTRPIVVLDVAHNRASIRALADVLGECFAGRRKWAVFAAAEDKDLRGMIEVLTAAFDEIIFTRFLENPRATAPEHLADLAKELADGRDWPTCATPEASWTWVAARAAPDDVICVTGSFFLVAETRRHIPRQTELRP